MLLPNSEFYPDATKHRAYRTCIQATNSRFSKRRFSLNQFGNSIVLVDSAEGSTEASYANYYIYTKMSRVQPILSTYQILIEYPSHSRRVWILPFDHLPKFPSSSLFVLNLE